MVQIVVIQEIRVIGLVVCRKQKMDCANLIIWVFGMQNALNIVIIRFVDATIVVQVVLMKAQELTGIVVIMKISFQNV